MAILVSTRTADGIMTGAMSPHISIDRDAVSAFCRRHHITRLALFGSVLRDDFRPDSDVDVLVEFEAGHVPGFFGPARMQLELEEIIEGRKVDLRTPGDLSCCFRDQVVATAEVLYQQSGSDPPYPHA